MSLSSKQLDIFIETSINRLSGERAPMHGRYCIDLRTYQQRITQKLVDDCIATCEARGLDAERRGDELNIHVDLGKCVMNEHQARLFNLALNHTRVVHGNEI